MAWPNCPAAIAKVHQT